MLSCRFYPRQQANSNIGGPWRVFRHFRAGIFYLVLTCMHPAEFNPLLVSGAGLLMLAKARPCPRFQPCKRREKRFSMQSQVYATSGLVLCA